MPAEPQPAWVLTRRRAIGDHIRAAREHANLSQEEAALRAGLARHNFNRIEQGHSAARIDSLIRIADAIGVPLADLVRQ